MPVAAADGFLVNLADTPANRAFFGSAGTADDSSPFPQLRIVAVTARAAPPTLNAPGRQRHSPRAQKARPKLPYSSATTMTAAGIPKVTVFAPGFS
jgi:hypothetical protein